MEWRDLHDDPSDEGLPRPEYIYGRLDLGEALTKHLHLLDIDGVGAKRGDSLQLIFYKYARTRERALELADLLDDAASNFRGLAEDVRNFILNHDFPGDGTTEGEREHHDA